MAKYTRNHTSDPEFLRGIATILAELVRRGEYATVKELAIDLELRLQDFQGVVDEPDMEELVKMLR